MTGVGRQRTGPWHVSPHASHEDARLRGGSPASLGSRVLRTGRPSPFAKSAQSRAMQGQNGHITPEQLQDLVTKTNQNPQDLGATQQNVVSRDRHAAEHHRSLTPAHKILERVNLDEIEKMSERLHPFAREAQLNRSQIKLREDLEKPGLLKDIFLAFAKFNADINKSFFLRLILLWMPHNPFLQTPRFLRAQPMAAYHACSMIKDVALILAKKAMDLLHQKLQHMSPNEQAGLCQKMLDPHEGKELAAQLYGEAVESLHKNPQDRAVREALWDAIRSITGYALPQEASCEEFLAVLMGGPPEKEMSFAQIKHYLYTTFYTQKDILEAVSNLLDKEAAFMSIPQIESP